MQPKKVTILIRQIWSLKEQLNAIREQLDDIEIAIALEVPDDQ